jgi:RHS repeat-associated protein
MVAVQDGLGSVRIEAGSTASILGTQTYAPFGSPFSTHGTFEGGFGFTGEQVDSSGQVYLRARYYTPSLGVFPSLDPFEGMSNRPMSLNGYAWVEGNTVNWVDCSGLITACGETNCRQYMQQNCLFFENSIYNIIQGVDNIVRRVEALIQDNCWLFEKMWNRLYPTNPINIPNTLPSYCNTPRGQTWTWEGHVDQIEGRQCRLLEYLECYSRRDITRKPAGEANTGYWCSLNQRLISFARPWAALNASGLTNQRVAGSATQQPIPEELPEDIVSEFRVEATLTPQRHPEPPPPFGRGQFVGGGEV